MSDHDHTLTVPPLLICKLCGHKYDKWEAIPETGTKNDFYTHERHSGNCPLCETHRARRIVWSEFNIPNAMTFSATESVSALALPTGGSIEGS